jgi:hypothetical protein
MSIVAQQSHQVSGSVRPDAFDRDDFLIEVILIKLQPAPEIQFTTSSGPLLRSSSR